MAERMADELTAPVPASGSTASSRRARASSPSSVRPRARDPRSSGTATSTRSTSSTRRRERRDGDLVGRGTADMKGPDAAMVAAVRLLREHGLPEPGRVLVTLHGMHESGGNEPLHALIARGIHGDAVITGELGGGVHLPIAGLGLTFWEIVVERPGMALHETVVARRNGGSGRGRAPGPRGARRAARPPRRRSGRRTTNARRCSSRSSLGRLLQPAAGRAELEGTRRHRRVERSAAVAAELEELVNRVRQATGAADRAQRRAVAEASRSIRPSR